MTALPRPKGDHGHHPEGQTVGVKAMRVGGGVLQDFTTMIRMAISDDAKPSLNNNHNNITEMIMIETRRTMLMMTIITISTIDNQKSNNRNNCNSNEDSNNKTRSNSYNSYIIVILVIATIINITILIVVLILVQATAGYWLSGLASQRRRPVAVAGWTGSLNSGITRVVFLSWP